MKGFFFLFLRKNTSKCLLSSSVARTQSLWWCMCTLQQGFDLKEDSPENFHQVANVAKSSKKTTHIGIASQSKLSGFHGIQTYCLSTTYFFQFLPPSPNWYLFSCVASLQTKSGIWCDQEKTKTTQYTLFWCTIFSRIQFTVCLHMPSCQHYWGCPQRDQQCLELLLLLKTLLTLLQSTKH